MPEIKINLYQRCNEMIFKAFSSVNNELIASSGFFSLNPDKDLPFFRFRYRNIPKDNELYLDLKSRVENFQGNYNWTISSKENRESYILVPSKFEKYLKSSSLKFTDIRFEEKNIDKFLQDLCEDIPQLCVVIVTSR